jgi:hypothetical protein
MRHRMRRPISGSRWLSLVTAATTAAALTLLGAATAQASPAVIQTAAASPAAAPVLAANTNAPCNVTPKPGDARCYAIVRTPADHDLRAAADRSGPPATALTPADIQSAYRLPATAGAGQTVAIVDAYGDSHAASDLAAFRSHYGLPACTTAGGCFRKVNQAGGTAYPADDSGWALETSLDLDAVSSACPRCHILLVEGSSPSIADLAAAENEAVKLGAKFISNSYGANEDPSLLGYDSAYQHTGVAVTVSTGDTGNLVEWPSSDPDVTAAGGTTLAKDPSVARGWDETAWDSGGSGCSTIEPQPQYQLGITTDCTMRATADVSADANPASGLGIYDTLGEGGWVQVGGTSLASPLIASMYALAGAPVAGTYPVNYPYHDPSQASDLFDITQGSNGSCGDVLCTAGPGWDGPTGLGSPDGVRAFSGGPQGRITGKVTDARTGKPVAGVTITASPGNYATRTGAGGTYTLGVTAGRYTVSATMYAYRTGRSGTETVPANGSATANFSLAELPHATVSGTVTDGSGHGWPLYAKITIGGGYPGAPVFTNPFTGRYRVVLAGPARYPVQVTSAQPEVLGTAGDGYAEQDVTLSVGTGTQSHHFALKVDKAVCAAPGYGPAGLAENFSGWAGGTPRAGWTVTGTRAGWRFDNPGSRPAPGDTDSGDQFAVADSGASGGRMDTALTSPAVNLSGQSAPAVRFTSGYYGGLGQHAEIDLSTDNGRTWSRVWHQDAGDAVGPVSVPIRQAAGQSRVRVRFRYAGDRAWWWSVGDVLIGTPGCAARPGGLVAGLVTQHGSGRPVDGATVTASGSAAGTAPGISAATGNPALSGGLYQLFSPAGRTTFTASASGYEAASATVPVSAGRLTRRDWTLTAKSGAARHAAPLAGRTVTTAAGQPGAAPARLVTLPGLRGRSYTVTLITGDRVRLTAAGGGRYSVSTVPSPAASPELSVSAVADRGRISTFQAMPSDAAGLIFSGRLDRGLFDLSWLIRHGDTGPRAALPLVLRYGSHLGAAALAGDARALPGASVTGVSAGTGTVRVRVAAGQAARFWAAITGRTEARYGAMKSSLAGGLTRVWLAGHQEGSAPAARPADGQLYTVTETIDGPTSKSRWCGNGQPLCVLPDFGLLGTSGDGTGQGFQPTGVTCAGGSNPCLAYQVTYSVPVGTYMASGFAVFTQDNQEQQLDLTVPQITVAGDTGFTVNANDARQITVRTPRSSYPVALALEAYRMLPDATFGMNFTFITYGYQRAWVIPSRPVTVGAFDYSSSWIMYSPTLAMSVASPQRLTLQPYYPSYASAPADPFTLFPGSRTLAVVSAGIGTKEQFSKVNVRGKLALVKLDPRVGGCLVEDSQLRNALAAGAAGVLVDSTLPPSVGTATCNMPVQPQWFYGEGTEVSIPFASLTPAQAHAVEHLLARGTVRIRVAGQASSPYQYDLKFYSEGKIPGATAYQVSDRTLTAVTARYHSAQPGVAEPSDTTFAPDEYFVAGVGDVLPAQATQTEYYGPDSPAEVWNRAPSLVIGGNQVEEPEAYDVFGQRGARIGEDWFDAPPALGAVASPTPVFAAQPGKYDSATSAVAGCADCRQGNVFYPLFYQVSGAAPGQIDGPFLFAPGSDIQLSHDGTVIPPTPVDGAATYPMPAKKQAYLLQVTDGGQSAAWRFTSGEPSATSSPPGFACVGTAFAGSTAPCAPDPLIFLRFNAFTGLDAAVSAQATHQVEVTPAYQATVAPARVTSLRLWISTDGGKTWLRETVKEHDGSYLASYRVPARSATDGSVSVRVQAADSAGDTVSQTLDDAWGISG